jgi:hypothetical protein
VQVLAVAFSPSGAMLATAEQPATSKGGESITLWEVATGEVRFRLAGHQGNVNCLAFSNDGRRLVSGSTDTTALIWDVTAPPDVTQSGKLSRMQAEQLWADLLVQDAAKSYRAACILASTSEGVRLLGKHLPPVKADARQVARLIADLNSDEFETRDRADRELEQLGTAAEPMLRKALENAPSPEVSFRVRGLLDRLSPEWLRMQRAVEALELSAAPEAKRLLQSLAAGSPDARLTKAVKAALERLELSHLAR